MHAERNNLLTASRQGTLLRCMRAHYWNCEIGLRKIASGYALKFGSAWHRAMEARWKGEPYTVAVERALTMDASGDIDAYGQFTLASLLAGYYKLYGDTETVATMNPEVEFKMPLAGSRTFTLAGKIDGLGTLTDGRLVLIESKTTSDSIAPQSDYWLRLRFNGQVYQYVLAARSLGWDISEVIYDVTRKPAIRPKMITDLDADGLKTVLDLESKRVYLKNGKPKQSATLDLGETLKAHKETPQEFGARLMADTLARPEFYFHRREVPILEDELQAFVHQRSMLAKLILHCRAEESKLQRPEDAWPRNVAADNCKFCSYKSFCLQNISPNLNDPSGGFEVGSYTPELTDTSVEEPEEVATA